jgi:hypothetical protein
MSACYGRVGGSCASQPIRYLAPSDRGGTSRGPESRHVPFRSPRINNQDVNRPVTRASNAVRGERRPLALLLCAAVTIPAGAVLATACSSGISTSLSTFSDLPALPAAFQVVYQVVPSVGVAGRRWEVLTQTAPFQVSDLTYESDPRTGAPPSTGTVSSFDHLYDLARGGLTLVSDRQPGPGSGVDAIAVELRELRDRGLAQLVGRSSVAGAPCQVARLGEPPVGPIGPPNGTGHDDICIDRSGIVLQEMWTYHGVAVLQRRAVEVRVGLPDPAIQGAPSASSAKPSRAPAILIVSPAQAPSYLAVPPRPVGFTVDPVVATAAYDPTDPTHVTDTSTIWAFSVGGAVLTVEAGQGQLPWRAGDAHAGLLNLNALGTASSALRSDGPEIRFQLDQGRWIRVRGTVPPQRLALYASELRLVGR